MKKITRPQRAGDGQAVRTRPLNDSELARAQGGVERTIHTNSGGSADNIVRVQLQ